MTRLPKLFILGEYVFFGVLFATAPIAVVAFTQLRVDASPSQTELHSPSEIVLPIANRSAPSIPILSAEHALAIDLKTGGILYEKNATVVAPPASLTKLATALVAIKNYQPDQVFTVKDEWQAVGNRAKLMPQEQLTRDDLLKALLISSGNDAAEVLANHHPAGRSAFLDEMNQLSENVGANNTVFLNPSGLDQPDHLSSAYDMGLLFRAVILEPTLLEILKTPQTTIKSIDDKYTHTLYSTNALLGRREEMIAGKTGSTFLAGQCLVALIEVDGHQIITVIFNSQERFSDTANLIEWLSKKYDWRTVQYVSSRTIE